MTDACSEWQRMFVILRNEGSCLLTHLLRFFAKAAQNDRMPAQNDKVFVILNGVKDLAFSPLDSSQKSSEWQRLFVILRNEGSCLLNLGLRFFAKAAQNDNSLLRLIFNRFYLRMTDLAKVTSFWFRMTDPRQDVIISVRNHWETNLC